MRVRAGFTLIELAVAVAILAIGTMAAYRSFDAAQRGIGGQLDRALATEVALNRAAELRLQGMQAGRGLPPVVSQGGRDWAVSVTESAMAGGLIEATIAVTAPERPGARLVAAVPARGVVMRKGFTLIELLAAMAILAVVSVMAVQALGGVFHQRAVLTRHDDRDRAVIRTLSLLRLDLARAVPMDPGARTPTGGLLIDATGVTVRIGGVVAVAGGAPARAGSGLATVTWQVRDGTLFRALDGAAQPVLTGVRALSVTPLQPDDDPWSLAAGFEALVQTDDPGPLRLVVAR